MTISAIIVADSISPLDIRLTTVETIYPWFIHGEVMTHRVFSRNASSNRAIPVAKLIAEARSDHLRACPSFSVINAPGMQGGRPTTEQERYYLRDSWRIAANQAADMAEKMATYGGAKQDVNRLLMPFCHARVLITATEWSNFFGLRLHSAAQPEARTLAEAIWYAMKESTPVLLQPRRDWHLPYVDAQSVTDCGRGETEQSMATLKMIKVSVARCARVSYKSFETGKPSTVEEDLALYERLMGSQPLHASPAEHQATPDTNVWNEVPASDMNWYHVHQWGNFKGWRQYRKMLAGEDKAPLPEGY